MGLPAAAQPAGAASSAAGIYTCSAPDGRRLTSDRPIPECMTREQRVLNGDGSLKRVMTPSLTPEERAEQEARDRKLQAERLARQDAIRRDRNLANRYPDEAAHRKAREAALDTVRTAIKTTEMRLRDLAAERKPLLAEAEFYRGKKGLPPGLRQQLDANDAAVDAQRSAALNQEAELARINKLYDQELDRLRQLWNGAAPGSGDTAVASDVKKVGGPK